MRIATVTQFDRSVDLIQRRQQALQSSHDQLVSGKRILRASDDPAQAANAERAMAQDARLETRQRALETSRETMVQSESALGDAVEVMQRMRELVLQVGAATGDAHRQSSAKELRGLRWLLLATWGVYPISYLLPQLGISGADSFVGRQIGYSIADVLAKCLYGLLIFKIARIKSADDDATFAAAEFKEAPSSKA